MAVRVTVLGCGGSAGVPLIGNDWGACDPADPRNRRTRPSVLVEVDGLAILIDTSPDLREQLIANRVRRIDAVLWTHGHADHTHGIDDLRGVNIMTGGPLPGYADAETMEALCSRFGYVFEPLHYGATMFYKPHVEPRLIEGPVEVGGVMVTPIVQDHGFSASLGFRIGAFAYSTDVVRLDETAFALLEGIDTWIVDCVRVAPEHPVHAHLPITLEWIERVRPRRAFLTHMNHTMDYETVRAMLPPGVLPAHDGLVIEVAG
ncbi:MBL fold metallo-hydrolase [Arenibaculum sp.]|uniref:MBL fold metallo-hydrolase n=1 Tax=Arenibaculum sp. TaxID=2865862 RepID=UPI002E116B5F|nr:MBL fold metallo-hydrolase [Arenibaculum sp.]